MLVPSRKIKKPSIIKSQVDRGLVCQAPGCCEPVTMFEGDGSDSYCNTHQLKLKGNGGLARPDRGYTFHKEWNCKWCGYDPREDQRFDRITDPVKKLRAQSASLICDHIVRQKLARQLGWTEDQIHGPDNIQTLCQICEKIKNSEEDDWDSTRDDE